MCSGARGISNYISNNRMSYTLSTHTSTGRNSRDGDTVHDSWAHRLYYFSIKDFAAPITILEYILFLATPNS